LNRSGFAGSQRYSIFPWTGDVSRSWSGLRAQLSILLGMTMSGVPYVHSDAGGFAGGEGDNELYVRWLQFATYTPIFRPHGTALYEKDPNAFSFPSEVVLIDTAYRKFAATAIRDRYSRLPYTYSLAYQQTKYGKPLMSPLYYYYPNDTTATKIQNEYMWGENMLVAPVLHKGIKEMQVYLPAGRWFLDSVYNGRRSISVPVTLDRIPLFIKMGSFIPGAFPLSSVKNDGDRYLNYFPETSWTSFDWYEDDGQSANALKTGNFTLIRCGGIEKHDRVELEISPNNFKYTPRKLLLFVNQVSSKPRLVLVNGKRIAIFEDKQKVKGDRFAFWYQEGSLQITTNLKEKLSIVIRK
jgi:oligosaccharide 4-alpha-D-glucosyltransferase